MVCLDCMGKGTRGKTEESPLEECTSNRYRHQYISTYLNCPVCVGKGAVRCDQCDETGKLVHSRHVMKNPIKNRPSNRFAGNSQSGERPQRF